MLLFSFLSIVREVLLRLPEQRVSMPSILKFGIQALDGLQSLHEQGLFT
jgi:hypothetical protein